MENIYHGFIEGVPKPQPRPRLGRNGTYNPSTADEWKTAVAIQVKSGIRNRKPFEGAIRVDMKFYLHRPKRLNTKASPDGVLLCQSKPDIDNLIKSVLDAITDTGAVWLDDNQVSACDVMKCYHAKKGSPGCELSIWGFPK